MRRFTCNLGIVSLAVLAAGLYSPRFAAADVVSDIPGLVLWLDAADSGTITQDGSGYVSQWGDKSPGNGAQNATQLTFANQPIYTADAWGAGKPVIRFDGTNDWMDTGGDIKDNFHIDELEDEFDIFCVFKDRGSTANKGVFSSWDAHSSISMGTRAIGHLQWVYNVNRISQSIGGRTEPCIWEMDYQNHDGIGYHDLTTYDNGTEYLTSAMFNATPTIPWENLTFDGNCAIRLCTWGTTAAYGPIDFAELIIYDGDLTVEQRNSIGVYLSEKWGIASEYVVPEPSTFALLFVSGLSLLIAAWKNRQ